MISVQTLLRTPKYGMSAHAAGEVKEVVAEYVHDCQARGILQLRIVHGKGTGALCRQVHALLGRMPEVAAFQLATPDAGGWGATLVTLQPV